MSSFHKKLENYRINNKTSNKEIIKIQCNQEESNYYLSLINQNQALPDGVILETDFFDGKENYYFFREVVNESANITNEERIEYLIYKNNENIETIKKCMIFFVVLTIIGLIIGFISVISLLENI